MDLRIASTALAAGMTIITRNVPDFRKVPGLAVVRVVEIAGMGCWRWI
jgi:predicted nucleic acid-binding protein